MTTLIQHFCTPKVINGVTINEILDDNQLRDQSYSFANIMREQYAIMENPNEEGVIINTTTFDPNFRLKISTI